jgi:hypothetical protein
MYKLDRRGGNALSLRPGLPRLRRQALGRVKAAHVRTYLCSEVSCHDRLDSRYALQQLKLNPKQLDRLSNLFIELSDLPLKQLHQLRCEVCLICQSNAF